MKGQIVIRSSKMNLNRRQSPVAGNLTPMETPVRTPSSNVGEVAGGTAANCFVVTCCCPCVVLEFFILAVYKIPASLCRRLWRKKRQKLLMKKKKKLGLLEEVKEGRSSVGETHSKVYVDEVSDIDWKEFEMIKVSIDGSAVELDKQTWDRFHNTGFWRSPSQRYNA